MAIEIKFDSANRPESPTFILVRRSGEKIGVINNITNIHVTDNMVSLSEVSFIVHKKKNGKKCNYWHNIKDFRLIYVPEWKKYFEVYVSQDESNEITKSISCFSLQEKELSNIKVYDIEINTEDDIARDDYVVTTLYNSENPKASLLNRLLYDKARHYSILHVDSSIANIQRTFSFNNISIYDAFMEIAEEINCIFVFGVPSDETSMMRTISVYDLESNCLSCGYRGEFTDECPECGSTNIKEGYGDDTTIFLSRENLTEDINFSTDTDSVKNCLRLEAGDDLMTSTVINLTPSKSQYLWHISDDDKEDMSDGLRTKLQNYDEKYEFYEKEYEADLDTDIVNKYNALVSKYRKFDETLEFIITPIIGFESLMTIYYNTVDFYGYLYNSLMPSVDTSGTTAKDQIALLTSQNLSPVSVQNSDYISLATANSTIISYAKVYIDIARYKIKVKDSSISDKTWTGNFTIESYYDDEDVADSQTITIIFNDDYENFIRQKLDKALVKSEDDDLSIIGLFKLDNDSFAEELKEYSYTYLQVIADSCQSCLDILIEQGVADKSAWTYSNGNLYEEIYIPYYTKKALIDSEIAIREDELAIVNGVTDEYGDLKTKGIKNYIDDIRNSIIKELDFESCIGEYWAELSSFRREDTWTNDNYISDGLSNSELFENAKKFLDAAKKDIYKASTLQHSISTTLKNLLVMDSFKPLVKHFKTGNWLRIQVDEEVYKLRLLSYKIEYDSLDKIQVEFSDVVKKLGVMSDIESVIKQSRSIATSYNSIKRQAAQGNESKNIVDDIIKNGLDASNTKVVSGANQEVMYDKHGLLFRKYNPDDGTYSPTQFRIINSTIAMTTNNWETSNLGLGEFEFYNPKTKQVETGYGLIARQIVGGMMLTEEIGIYNRSGSLTIDENGLNITNGTNSFTVDPNSTSLLTIKKGNVPVFTVTDTGELSFTGNVITETLTLGTNGLYENNGTTSISIAPKDISILTLQKGTEKVLFFDSTGELNIKGNIIATSLTLEKDVSIDISNFEGLNDFVKKDTVIGNTPTQNTTGFLLSSTGLLKSSGATLYNTELYTTVGNIAGFSVGDGYLRNCDSNKKYTGIGILGKANAFFAGGTSTNGDDGVFRVDHTGHLYSSNLTIENGGFEVKDLNSNKVLGVSSSGNITMLDAWGNMGNVVLSDTENTIKFEVNGDNLEIWINKNLAVTLPNGYAPTS